MFESLNEHYAGSANGRSHQPVDCFTHTHGMNTLRNTETATLGSSNKVMDPYSVEYENINDSFPFKLHMMLGEIEEQGLGHVVSWQPHGRCFVVRDRNEFVKLMQSYFRISKYESFQRQLNLYGFNRITAGRDKGGYYHESFVRARRDLCFEIQRQKVKGTFVRKPATRENEPNFYKLPPSSAPEHGTQNNPPTSPHPQFPMLQTPQNVFTANDMRSGPSVSSATLGQSLVSVMAPQVVDANMMMQSLMNLSPCLAATMATMYNGGLCQRGEEGGRPPSYPAFGDASPSSSTSPSTPHAAEQPLFGGQQQAHTPSTQKPAHQQIILDDLDTSFENLLSALRAMDSAYLLSIGQGA